MKITIVKRLGGLIAVAALGLLFVGGVGLFTSSRLFESLAVLNGSTLPSINAIDATEVELLRLQGSVRSHMLIGSEERKAAIEQIIKGELDKISEQSRQFQALQTDAGGRPLAEAALAAIEDFKSAANEVLQFSRQDQSVDARVASDTRLVPAGEAAYAALEKLADFNEQRSAQEAVAAERFGTRARFASAAVIVIALLATGGIGIFLVRSIGAGLAGVQETVARIERERDFTLRVPAKGEDELGLTAKALNQLLTSMQRDLGAISTGARSVAEASTRMSETSGQVAGAAQAQSAAAASMAAAVEEMTVSISHVGDRAAEARMLSNSSGELAASGERVIGQTVEDINSIAGAVERAAGSIRELGAQSEQISSVVAVIREVADQTNLLALNAAIEAARAGEQGRGFAVVADEVRKLAERTAQSTQEISAMVERVRHGARTAVDGMEQAVERVNDGVQRAQDASASIHQIGNASRQAVDMVSEITDAIREQGATSTAIAQQVERIAQMSDESSAAAGESADAARELDRLAASMQQVVAAYRL
ncbi:MAG: methyl-accepting chemotaxis protein [Candidatus Dactylopiibacterium sp.]|nr:methyl-accepting chemotaxis protein [Candidatus Dactylopiibacterium sp.]